MFTVDKDAAAFIKKNTGAISISLKLEPAAGG